MGIAYDPTIPSTGGRPSAQYTDIQTNFASIQTLIDVNHVDFANTGYGKHTKVEYLQAVTPTAPTGTQSVSFPGNFAGTSYATQIGPFFQNASTTLLCGVNAFVRFNGNNGAVVSKYGVYTVSRSSSGVYVITWGTNAGAVVLPSANYAPIISLSGQTNFAVWYELTSVTAASMTISCFINNGSKAASDPSTVSILIVGA